MKDSAPPTVETAHDLIEFVMTQHWDIFACGCFFCVHGTRLGLRPREQHLPFRHDKRYAVRNIAHDDDFLRGTGFTKAKS